MASIFRGLPPASRPDAWSRAPMRLQAVTPLAAAALLAFAGAAGAQDATSATPGAAAASTPATTPARSPATATPPVQSVNVVSHGGADGSGLTGFSEPLSRTPMQVDVISARSLADIGATSLSDLTRLDASLTDSYNAIGYWTTFTLRGFQVDNRYNFRRDGLPINAETVLSLDDKSDVEILKGLSGMQAGTSAPGGLVDLVVKRPDVDLRKVSLSWWQNDSLGVAADLSQRFGENRAFGARLNVAADHLDPNVRDAEGHRQSVSLATDWRIDGDHLLEFEFEHNLQSQPSVPGFSMLGDVVPDPHAIDPHINLNDQPWSLPVVTQGNTMSLRYTQAIDADWHVRVHALQQQLVSNDHLAFPYGVYSDPDHCDPCDRFSSDGHYSIWDFRSDNERRQTRDLDVSLSGEFGTGPLHHSLTTGVLLTRFKARFEDEAYNLSAFGTLDGDTVVPAAPDATSPNTHRTERSDEFYLRDAIKFGPNWTAWAGLRHTSLHRSTSETASGNPDAATDYGQSFTTPWLSVSRQFGEHDMGYVSWGEGVESSVVPNLPIYANQGQPLPSSVSKQWEIGYKHDAGADQWSLTAYDVVQPQWTDEPLPADPAHPDAPSLQRTRDGDIRARGLEAQVQTRVGAFSLRASAMWQRVRSEGADPTSGNGPVPVNVPMRALKLSTAYAVPYMPGLNLLADMDYEGGREVLPDDSATIPGWARFDLGARYVQRVSDGTTLTWRAGVDNVADRRAWREAPYQYGHTYLFPMASRTFHASVEANF